MRLIRTKPMIRAVLLILAISLLSATVSAQDKNKKGTGGVIRLEETVIEGRVAKPNAFFINTRQALVYDSMEIKESFVEEITKAVDSGLF